MATLLTLLLLFNASGTVGASRTPTRATDIDVRRLLSQLHGNGSWDRISPKELDRLIGSRLGADLPLREDDALCGGTILYTNDDSKQPDGYALTAKFESVTSGSRCRLALRGISVLMTLPMREAVPLGVGVVELLKPGGRPSGDDVQQQFIWRSIDSRVQYDLWVEVKPIEASATPKSSATLKVILEHTPVTPADVDDLPFFKGYFHPKCQSTEP